MWCRRVIFNTQLAASIFLPLWLLVGRVFFGVILGWHYAIQLFLAPLLFVFLAIVATLSWARKSVRSNRAVSRLDAALLSSWYVSILAYGFFVVDSVHSDEPGKSVATVVFGQSFRDASFTIADIFGALAIILALLTFWLVLIEYLVESRPRTVSKFTGLADGELRIFADDAAIETSSPGRAVPLGPLEP